MHANTSCATAAPAPPDGPAVSSWEITAGRWDPPSPFEFAPPSIQARLLASRFQIDHDNHPAPARPAVPVELIRKMWSRRLDIHTAVTLTAICGDSDTLEWILGKDRRKAVRHAALTNPALDVAVLWDPDRGAHAFSSTDLLDHLAEGVHAYWRSS